MPFVLDASPYLEMFWSFLIQESLYASLIFALVWLLMRMPRLQAPRVRLALWSLVFIRLVLPPSLSAPWSISALFGQVQPTLISNPFKTLGDHGTSPESLLLHANPAVDTSHLIWWVLSALWLLGCAYFTIRFYRSRRSFQTIIQQAHTVSDPAVLRSQAQWRHQLGIGRKIRVVTSERNLSPFTMGSFRPVVFLPQAILCENQATWEPALAHEFAHIKRWDDAWIQILALLKAVYFFHPLVWLCLRHSHHERERLCDRMVIRKSDMTPSEYGRGLLATFAKQLHVVRESPALSPAAQRVATRLASLHQYEKGRTISWMSLLLVLGMALFILPMATMRGVAAWEPFGELSWDAPLPQAKTSSHFGYRKHPFSKKHAFHKGVDLVAPKGTWIHAPAAGVVIHATTTYEQGDSYGTVVVIKHDQTYTSLFSHLDALAVRPGQQITKGTRLGTVGTTGQTTAAHLHFELWEHGTPIDPLTFLDAKIP